MPEIEYAVTNGRNKRIEVNIPNEYYGSGIERTGSSGRSGSRRGGDAQFFDPWTRQNFLVGEDIGLNICRHRDEFSMQPSPAPNRPGFDMTGQYEVIDCTNIMELKGTARVNQAGNYIYGWFEIDGVPTSHAYRIIYFRGGEFMGRVVGDCSVKIQLGNRTRQRPMTMNGKISRPRGLTDLFRLDFDRNDNSETTSITFQRIDRGFHEPRLSTRELEGLRDRSPVLYAAEVHPLRTDQVNQMHRFMYNVLGEIIRGVNASHDAAQGVWAMGLFTYFSKIFRRYRKLPLGACRSCRNPRDGKVSWSRGEFLGSCTCGMLFRQEQTELVKWTLLNYLDRELLDGISFLQSLYNINENLVNRTDASFREFRELFFDLPETLGTFKYHFIMTFLEAEARVGPLPIKGRVFDLQITREKRTGSEWIRDDRNEPFTSAGVIGFVGIGAERGHTIGISQGGILEFDIITRIRWTHQKFPGLFLMFNSGAKVDFPFGLSGGVEKNMIGLRGNNAADIVAEMENCEERELNIKGEISAKAFIGWGWIFHGGEYEASAPPNRIDRRIPLAELEVSIVSPHHYHFDVFELSPDARTELGALLAEYIALLKSPNSDLRIEGHTSRRGSWFHNDVLSIKRTQFVLQEIVDIADTSLAIPLRGGREGTVRLFFEGERYAAKELGTEDGVDNVDDRCVLIGINGSVVIRLRGDLP